jgi:hypothetical protein
MSPIPTVLSPDELDDLIELRRQIVQLTARSYITAHHATCIDATQLADLCQLIAEHLTLANNLAHHAIFIAASAPPEVPYAQN